MSKAEAILAGIGLFVGAGVVVLGYGAYLAGVEIKHLERLFRLRHKSNTEQRE